MKNKGQVTVFIIIGIVILLIVGLLLYFGKSSTVIGEVKEGTSDNVKSFVQTCLKDTLEKGVYLVAKQGGYYSLPDKSTSEAVINTAYYFYLKTGTLPGKKTLEAQIQDYVNDQLPFCLRNFVNFKGVSITKGKLSTKVSFSKKQVNALLIYPLKIKKGDQITTMSNFQTSVSSRLLVLYQAAQNLTEIQKEVPDQICLSCIYDLAEDNNINISVTEVGTDSLLFVLIDEETNKKDPLIFRYANKYPLQK